MSGSSQSESQHGQGRRWSPGVTVHSFSPKSFLEKIEMWFRSLTSLLYWWKPGSLVRSVASFLVACRLTYIGRAAESKAWAETGAASFLSDRVLVFIVIEKFYDHIFLFMFSGSGWQTAQPTRSFLFYCLLVLFSVASLCPLHFISRTYAAPHTCARVKAVRMEKDEQSFLDASGLKYESLPFLGWSLCRAAW